MDYGRVATAAVLLLRQFVTGASRNMLKDEEAQEVEKEERNEWEVEAIETIYFFWNPKGPNKVK